MAAPYHCICSKLDRALVLYLIERGAGTAADTWPAKRSLDRSPPCTIAYTERADPIPNTGNYTCRAAVMVKANATDYTAAASDARTAAAFDAFYTIADDSDWDSKKVAAQITAAARAGALADPATYGDLVDFTALDVRLGAQEASFEDDVWVETLSLEIDAAPSNVS
jgi:hypothetical protein